MRTFPIIPIWIMLIVCISLIIFIIIKSNNKIIEIAIVILIFIINLRIMIPGDNYKSVSNNLDVLFVIDNTISMNAEDYNGNETRLSGVKKDCNYIIERLSGARFSIITFNNKAQIIIPFINDINLAMETIDIIEPIDELYAKGSSLNTPIETILMSLNSSEKKDNRIRVIFFISDGEITKNESLSSYREIREHINNGAVLGYGTSKGGNMKSRNKFLYEDEYIRDNTSLNHDIAVSKIDESNLKKIASDINIDYIHMNKEENINSKLREIEKLASSSIDDSSKKTYDDIYFIFVIPLLALLFLELHNIRRKV